ncbi:MAG: sodium ion-translocating decarboxylase subunit beta [Candidatus Competibacteraceae bacterium]|nr:sodium ion-translocating decarboxylase subunit beta [Candidatus Competibacteraceae bacterium]MBK7982199.1 sodium ion-translocating decarboxylase subunit beta [Candidatus Competibacteraceae bacterium]MBK8899248.1 sodium ion-translocating decarboxylase subunit beta [Candidatus Competibacteraceae bacterium]MBK8963287.1 sodium ion-translocating decarboxylase subunit beta [Candidatus Competibacteraceae bacterium]MBK9952247.1 sodium ion-translocating decarboxylase subunit beta [Candidatus Competib
MESLNFLDLFQGINTLIQGFSTDPKIAFGRVFLIFLGFLLFYLGRKGVLEALLMIPMGLGMATVNAGVMFFYNMDPASGMTFEALQAAGQTVPAQIAGTLHVAPLAQDTNALMNILQIDWLQPIYTFMFSNGLIACFVFMGIGTLLDVGFVMARPYQSMIIALFAELGTATVYPLAVAMGLAPGEAASVAIIGGADGPMVLFTSLMLAKPLFVPITVVAYLYLGLAYGGYPYLIKLLVPEHLRNMPMPVEKSRPISSNEKLVFAIIACVLLSLLFPVASPLLLSLFLGVVVRESDLPNYLEFFSNTVLYGSTFFLGLLLGILCEANTILNPVVLKLLVLGILSLLISGIGGIIGGYVLYYWSGKKYNPVIGIAGVSCVPTTAKVAQKSVGPGVIVLPHALGANISGVITTAIFAAVYVALLLPKG